MKVKEKIQKITFINDVYTKWKWRERTVSYGNEDVYKRQIYLSFPAMWKEWLLVY